MTCATIDGKALAAAMRLEQRVLSDGIAARLGRRPRLDVVLAGDDPASLVYVRAKERACEQAGVASRVHRLPGTASEAELLGLVARLNADGEVDGILVQLPLPAHIGVGRVIAAVDPAKDVDGFHPLNAGALLTGLGGFAPCTPAGCVRMLEHYGHAIEGKRAVVVGRSNIVGKPAALLLLARGATVSVAHSRTPPGELAALTRSADILVAACGKPRFITAGMVKEGAVVIDVGMHRDAQGRLCGDVDEGVRAKASALTPVPGGVGPMTIAMLIENTLAAARAAADKRNQ
ncbi:MAG: bifunctional 5,10-methylenetetrahydrofolate dehydrogenase/5,10-methenyltetrahydrofolate cyclohydrolase [Duodenibacillus sp.]|nr:bifunctional 5,10-methylenetetrahydrofolate dehydrogenase/5,10-methenyltetrahydrofolate cyclohydrolase [Duodenibacillus sp.]